MRVIIDLYHELVLVTFCANLKVVQSLSAIYVLLVSDQVKSDPNVFFALFFNVFDVNMDSLLYD